MVKQALRQENKNTVQAMAPDDKIARDRLITQQFLEIFPSYDAEIVSAYNPMPFEVDCQTILETLYDQGKRICFPSRLNMDHAQMVFREMTREQYDASMKNDFFMQGAQYPLVTPDLLIIPLLGFHPYGYRLGYGGGYYDQTLYELRQQRKITAVGLGYACTQISDMFFESHDQKLDVIITEEQVLDPS